MHIHQDIEEQPMETMEDNIAVRTDAARNISCTWDLTGGRHVWKCIIQWGWLVKRKVKSTAKVESSSESVTKSSSRWLQY